MLTRTQKRTREIKRAVAQLLPAMKVTSENLAQVRWHLYSEDCEEWKLKPLSDLMTGKFVPDADDPVHLHPPKKSYGQREQPTGAVPQDSGSVEEYDDDGGRDDDERVEVDDNDDEKTQEEDHGGTLPATDDAASEDSQTNEMDEDLNDDFLYIKVIYDLKGVPEIPQKWRKVGELPTEVLFFPRNLSLPEVYDRLAVVVERRLNKQAKECYDRLVASGKSILLKPSLEDECPVKQRAFNFDDRGIPRVAEVNDLLREVMDPQTGVIEREMQPQLTMKLTLIDLIKRVEATDPFIAIRPGAVTKDIGGIACLYRVGAQARKQSSRHAVGVSDAWFWYCDRGDNPTGAKLVEAYHWSLRDLEICSPCEGRICADNLARLEEADIEGPTTTAILRQKLKSSRKLQPYVEGNLLYNFREWAFDTAAEFDVDPVKKWPGQDITVAVRYISHLKGKEAEALKFPLGEEIECGEKDNHKSLCAAFARNLQKVNAKSALFRPPSKDSWRLELWVMPQISEGRSLFRFDDNAKLMHWLHESYVAEGDMTLFAEVHLCPVAPTIVTTRSGRKVQPKK